MENGELCYSDVSSQYHDIECGQKYAAAGDCTGGQKNGGPNILTKAEFHSSI